MLSTLLHTPIYIQTPACYGAQSNTSLRATQLTILEKRRCGYQICAACAVLVINPHSFVIVCSKNSNNQFHEPTHSLSFVSTPHSVCSLWLELAPSFLAPFVFYLLSAVDAPNNKNNDNTFMNNILQNFSISFSTSCSCCCLTHYENA